ncbi:hypothetical protein HUJ05_006064 [Dendroctonus ponderosae]|nr:hypothetical protein HUJ05_006064 [Dendroctonus ponderosae]
MPILPHTCSTTAFLTLTTYLSTIHDQSGRLSSRRNVSGKIKSAPASFCLCALLRPLRNLLPGLFGRGKSERLGAARTPPSEERGYSEVACAGWLDTLGAVAVGIRGPIEATFERKIALQLAFDQLKFRVADWPKYRSNIALDA